MQAANSRAGQSLPIPLPASPPSTPRDSSSSPDKLSRSPYVSPRRGGRQGPSNHDFTPPEHLEPKIGHNFSYRPSSDASYSTSSGGSVDHDEDSGPEVESQSDIAERRKSINVRPVDPEKDFMVEEMTENDMNYDSDLVQRPYTCEDALSEKECNDTAELADEFQNLDCQDLKDKEFADNQRKQYEKKQKKWRRGGNKKRNHEQSVGSGSDDNEDCPQLETQDVGSSASCLDGNRRTRRRTEGPDARPRHSLIFDDPPREIEELKHLSEAAGYQPLYSDGSDVGGDGGHLTEDEDSDEEL